MSPVPDADPRARELDAQFAAAMSGPSKPRSDPKPPPEIDPEAPFGRDEDGEPIAKYGRTSDGRIRRSAGGRPRKDGSEARVTDKPPAGDPGKPVTGKVVTPDYTADLVGAADGLWLMLTAAGKMPLARLRVGRYGLPANARDRVAAQAYLLDAHKLKLAAALNEAAKHNGHARRWAEKLSGDDLSWVLTVGALALPFGFQSLAIWRGGDKRLAELELPSLGELAELNDEQMKDYLQLVMAAAADQAAASEIAAAAATAAA